MKKQLLYSVVVIAILVSCRTLEPNNSYPYVPYVPEEPQTPTEPEQPTDPIVYADLIDPISDQGQYWQPQFNTIPSKLITVKGGTDADPNHIDRGHQSTLLSNSVAGLVNRALNSGKTDIGVWIDHNRRCYDVARNYLAGENCDINWSTATASKLITDHDQLRGLFSGYVLTDIVANPESGNAATVAAHVYNAFIVDVRDLDVYSAALDAGGQPYKMLYDARTKTIADAWREFKDKCNKNALVVMGYSKGELRDFAITNNLFYFSITKPNGGNYNALFEEILAWLAPNSPVYGWEGGDESAFVNQVTQYGHKMVPYDHAYNTSLNSVNYINRQKPIKAKYTNPNLINFEDNASQYVTYYLSDGDNMQWMLNDFAEDGRFYKNSNGPAMKMAYGLSFANLTMIAPSWYEDIMNRQPENCTLIENFGGGYYYVDTFGKKANRAFVLDQTAKQMAAHMRQHGIKILGTIAKSVNSAEAKEAYQKFISANNQLEAIMAIQYSPYAGGAGNIMWFRNSDGIEIPVITARYTLWNFPDGYMAREGKLDYIAPKLLAEPESSKFSVISVHAWSSFYDNSGNAGATAAKLFHEKLNNKFRLVNLHEMIWRVRMDHNPEQTKAYIKRLM